MSDLSTVWMLVQARERARDRLLDACDLIVRRGVPRDEFAEAKRMIARADALTDAIDADQEPLAALLSTPLAADDLERLALKLQGDIARLDHARVALETRYPPRDMSS